MPVLELADGRLLRRQAPAGVGSGSRFMQQAYFPPMWSDGERWGDKGRLASFAEIYTTQPSVYAVVNLITRRIASLPLKAYRRKADGSKSELARTHPLSELLRKPLPRRSAVSMKQWMALPTLIHGNALVAKVRARADEPPAQLLPLDWAHVNAYAAPGGFVEWWSTTQFENGVERYLAAEDTLHFAWESAYGEIGTSPLQALGTTIRLDTAAQTHQTSSFSEGIKPSMIISLPETARVKEPDLDRIGARIQALYGGTQNAGRAMVLGNGATAQPITMTSSEAELVESRRVAVEEVARAYDVPGPLINDLRYATYSNISEQYTALYRDILPPWLELFEQTIQAQLIDPEEQWQGLFVEFELKEKLKGTPAELAQVIQTEIATGVLSPEEGRTLLNLSPSGQDGADQLYLPVNNLGPIGSTPTRAPQAVVPPNAADQQSQTPPPNTSAR